MQRYRLFARYNDVAKMSDSSSEDENLAKFKESAVTIDDLKPDISLTRVEKTHTNRNFDASKNDENDHADTGITPEFQDFISKKLDKLLEK